MAALIPACCSAMNVSAAACLGIRLAGPGTSSLTGAAPGCGRAWLLNIPPTSSQALNPWRLHTARTQRSPHLRIKAARLPSRRKTHEPVHPDYFGMRKFWLTQPIWGRSRAAGQLPPGQLAPCASSLTWAYTSSARRTRERGAEQVECHHSPGLRMPLHPDEGMASQPGAACLVSAPGTGIRGALPASSITWLRLGGDWS